MTFGSRPFSGLDIVNIEKQYSFFTVCPLSRDKGYEGPIMLLQNASNLNYIYNEVARIVLAVLLARLGFWIYNQYKARGDAAAQRDRDDQHSE